MRAEVEVNHYHRCPKCRTVYPAYNPNCKDPHTLVCGPCLADYFIERT